VSYSVKLTNKVILSGFAAIKPDCLFSHRALIATNVSRASSNQVINLGGSTQVSFDLSTYIGKKGLRFHDRSSKLIAAAIKILLDDTQLLERYSNTDVCLVVGSDGALHSQDEVVREAMLTPRSLNPKAYPNRGCNVIAGQASLMFQLLGESTVVSSGYRSGIDALIYAVRKVLVSDRPAPYIVAAGEGLSEARSLRKKHKTCAGTDYIAAIEGSVALLIEKDSQSTSIHPGSYQVIGYQQAYDTATPLDAMQAFIVALGYQSQAIDPIILGCEDVVHVYTAAATQTVPYDVFGATTLLKLLEVIGLIGLSDPTQAKDIPKRVAIGSADRHGSISMLLLQQT
jgi:hypothetical protein